VLLAVGGFTSTRHSLCEDVTLARHLARAGHAVGFYESEALVSVRMYGSGWEAWQNWPRSLPLRDQYAGPAAVRGLLEVSLVQALPLAALAGSLVVVAGSARRVPGLLCATRLARRSIGTTSSGSPEQPGRRSAGPGIVSAMVVNGLLGAIRLGVLAGTARAYRRAPWSYWLSPLADIPVALALWSSLCRRHHVWRGRRMVTRAPRVTPRVALRAEPGTAIRPPVGGREV
jgi:dolichol-phosphate mannosyltransferase